MNLKYNTSEIISKLHLPCPFRDGVEEYNFILLYVFVSKTYRGGQTKLFEKKSTFILPHLPRHYHGNFILFICSLLLCKEIKVGNENYFHFRHNKPCNNSRISDFWPGA